MKLLGSFSGKAQSLSAPPLGVGISGTPPWLSLRRELSKIFDF
jgi:hypothetical protein